MEQGRSPGSGSGAHSALAPLTRRNRSSVRDAAAFKGVGPMPRGRGRWAYPKRMTSLPAAAKWGFKTWQCEYRFEALEEVIEEPDG